MYVTPPSQAVSTHRVPASVKTHAVLPRGWSPSSHSATHVCCFVRGGPQSNLATVLCVWSAAEIIGLNAHGLTFHSF